MVLKKGGVSVVENTEFQNAFYENRKMESRRPFGIL